MLTFSELEDRFKKSRNGVVKLDHNTYAYYVPTESYFDIRLHGNTIAKLSPAQLQVFPHVYLNSNGCVSPTTKKRLNDLRWGNFYQSDGRLYFYTSNDALTSNGISRLEVDDGDTFTYCKGSSRPLKPMRTEVGTIDEMWHDILTLRLLFGLQNEFLTLDIPTYKSAKFVKKLLVYYKPYCIDHSETRILVNEEKESINSLEKLRLLNSLSPKALEVYQEEHQRLCG